MKSKIPIPVFVFVIAIATFSRMEAASFTPLGFPESVDDGAYGVSDDGTFVGGYASKEETGPDYVRLRRQAVRWTVARAGADAVGLGLLPEAKESRVFGMSADGQVLVGESSGRAFRWSAA
jgi:uncharacterized membrane protein